MHEYKIMVQSKEDGLWQEVYSCETRQSKVEKRFLFWKYLENEDDHPQTRIFIASRAKALMEEFPNSGNVQIENHVWDGFWYWKTIWRNGVWI